MFESSQLKNETGKLQQVEAVLRSIGFNIVGDKPEDLKKIDLIWTLDSPYLAYHEGFFKSLMSSQRLNHVQPLGPMCSKAVISKPLPHIIPYSFALPQDFNNWKELISKDKGKKYQWVTKAKSHRMVNFLPNPEKVTLESLKKSGVDVDNTMIQQFIDKPLLIDNHKFDFGIYVLVTSTFPTRVYIHTTRMVLRFCPEPYEPFDPTNRLSYVIEGNYKPSEEIPSINKYLSRNISRYATLMEYLEEKGYNTEQTEAKITAIIKKTIYMTKKYWFPNEDVLLSRSRQNKISTEDGTSMAFELFRFDLIIEDLGSGQLRPWLMEVNLSPNLQADEHTIGIRHLLFDTFSTIGATRQGKPWQDEEKGNESGEFNEEDLPRLGCDKICTKEEMEREDYCKICSMETFPKHAIGMIRQTISEQLGKRHFKRVIPPAPSRDQSWKEYMAHLDKLSGKTQSPKDKILATWLFLSCQMEMSWCY